MWTFVIVELHPFFDPGFGLYPGFPGMEINALVFQRPPQAFDEDVVEEPTLAVHRDPDADPLQSVSPNEGRELAALDALLSVKPRFEPD